MISMERADKIMMPKSCSYFKYYLADTVRIANRTKNNALL